MHPEAALELIERARSDRSAFGEIYDLYVRRVYAFCLAQTRNHDEAEDVTAQTFERALNAIGRYEHRGAPFSAWLFRVAANIMVDRARQGGRIVFMGDDPLPEPEPSASADPTPEQWVDQWERAAWVRTHLASLPADQREAIRLRFWEGLSIGEVAARMGRNENAMKQLLHRAVVNLRARVEPEGENHA